MTDWLFIHHTLEKKIENDDDARIKHVCRRQHGNIKIKKGTSHNNNISSKKITVIDLQIDQYCMEMKRKFS